MKKWWYIKLPLGCIGLNLCYENQPVYVVISTVRCFISEKYKTNKYILGRERRC